MTPPRLETHAPGAGLEDVVRQHQLVRLHFAADVIVPEKPYWPRPAAALAFYLRAPEIIRAPGAAPAAKPRAVIVGQPSVVTWRRGGPDFAVYQIELQPGALHRLTGLHLKDLTDGWVDAEAVLPVTFGGLVRQLEDLADGPAAPMIAAAESWLRAALPPNRREDVAADGAARWLMSRPLADIDDVALRCGLSTRQMRRLFDTRVGVSPKLFARVARFDGLIRLRNRSPDDDWLTAALAAGYYDHQHLRRDFRQFTLLGPRAFLALEQSAPERAFGLRET